MKKLNILLIDDREENLVALEALIRRDDLNIIQTTDPAAQSMHQILYSIYPLLS